jgi:transposase-like protein
MTQIFDFEKALSELQAGKDLTGKNGILMPLIKQLTEAVITAELEHHLAHEEDPNRKNGKGSKIVKTGSGSFELNAPRDRAGTFEPQLIKKHQTQLTPEIDRKIISLFSHGMSYRDIQTHLQDLYGIDVSTGTLSGITDQLLPALKEWQQRPLERIYSIMWMDAVHYKKCL